VTAYAASQSAPDTRTPRQRWGWGSSFWLNFMFFCARRVGWFMRWARPGFMALSEVCFRKPLRRGPVANAKWLLGPDTTWRQRQRFARAVLNSFYLFIYDVGRASGQTARQIESRIVEIENYDCYEAARAQRRGAILATAHLGSFEVGMAAARQLESHVHVVFQRDRFEAFNQIRHALHRKLGVHEAPIDAGLGIWLELRDALGRDEVVMMQADRVLPETLHAMPALGVEVLDWLQSPIRGGAGKGRRGNVEYLALLRSTLGNP